MGIVKEVIKSSGAEGGAAAPKGVLSAEMKPTADEIAFKPAAPDVSPEDQAGAPRGP